MRNKFVGLIATFILISSAYAKEEIVHHLNKPYKYKFLKAKLITGNKNLNRYSIKPFPIIIETEIENKKCSIVGEATFYSHKLSSLICDNSVKEINGFFFNKNKNLGPYISSDFLYLDFHIEAQDGFVYILEEDFLKEETKKKLIEKINNK
ncbi:hypothetical protein ACNSOL_11685 (plasmid) [Aliarcobacter lanthieri]|uniref:hypothetical protein n=1 Tax=Aliarcobacter lanthieri TaxID=1355374 RepID=UPI003AB029CF